MMETINAVDAWLGSLPGHVYANVRQPPISTLNLAHMIPLSAVWAGPERDEHFAAPPLLFGKTEGSTPFRFSLHVGDVGHTLIVGPTGAGKSVLLALMALQFRRYRDAQVFAFDFGGSPARQTLSIQQRRFRSPHLWRRADMGGTGVIDHFLDVFTHYIDSGFGMLKPKVAFIATTLIVIDVVLAALFWSWGADEDIIARLVKKTLFVGVFAYIIGNWNNLARIVFESFAGLGLKASGTGFAVADLLRPGKVAQTGLDAGRPLLDSISNLMGLVSFFENFIQVACLLFAWALILLAFFILAVQLFVTLIEFKLTTLAGFVLIPFGLFGKSAFMAERVLGNVISSGIKVLVLAVIIGIGSTLFSEFTRGFNGATPSIDDAMAIVLAALSLLGLGIFGPGIANGLVSGGPQLGAGAAIGTGLAAGGMVAAGGAAVGAVASGGASLIGGAAAAARGGATLAGGASTAYSLGAAGQSGASAVASGLGNVASTGASKAGSAIASPFRRAATSIKDSFEAGSRAVSGEAGAAEAEAGSVSSSTPSSSADGPPTWAKRMQRSQKMSHGVQAAAHAVKSGDAHGGGSSVNLSESD